MPQKFLFSVFFIFLLGLFPVRAANVSVMVIEAGLPNDNRPAHQYSIMWENGLMDVYFEMGHIVSNSPIMRLGRMPDSGFPYEAERDFDEARDTGMEYFVVAIINHPSPYNVSLRIFNTNSHELIKELSFIDNLSLPEKDRYERIKNTVLLTSDWIR